MPPKRNRSSKKKKGRQKKAAAAATTNDAAPQRQQTNQEKQRLAQAMLQDPDEVEGISSLIEYMATTGLGPDEAMAHLMASMRHDEQQEEEPAFQDTEKRCNRQGCELEGEFLCIGCSCHYYCGKDCQRIAWRAGGHKQECKLLQKCRGIKSMRQSVAMGDSMTLGVVRTKKHGNHIFATEQYQPLGDESNRMVPLASIAFEGSNPTYADVTMCLINAILYPEFDTKCAGARRPCFVTIQSESFGDALVAEHLAAVCHRLGIIVKDMGKDETLQDGWDSCWFCVQQGWNDEFQDNSFFLSMIDASRRHPVPPNGSVRKELLPVLEKYNERAQAAASTPPNLEALRAQIMSFPYEKTRVSQNELRTTAVAVHEGVLFVMASPESKLLYQERVVLDPTTHRPSSDIVLGALYKALIRLKRRPSMVHLGQPSICSHQDVEVYEEALDDSIVEGSCALGALDNVEGNVRMLFPQWRRMGLALLIDK